DGVLPGDLRLPARLLPDHEPAARVRAALPAGAAERPGVLDDLPRAARRGAGPERLLRGRRLGARLAAGGHRPGRLDVALALLAAHGLPDHEAAAGLGAALPAGAAVGAAALDDLAVADRARADDDALGRHVLARAARGDHLERLLHADGAAVHLLPDREPAAGLLLAAVAVAAVALRVLDDFARAAGGRALGNRAQLAPHAHALLVA